MARAILPVALVLLAAAMAAASPAPHAVFKRSCAECSDEYYCEFAYPDAPDGTVACVRYPAGRRLLYRAYAAPCDGSNPCQNGGTCSSGTCLCSPPFEGSNCETCNAAQCQNGGTQVLTCAQGMGCQCSTGWSGPTCEQAIVCANQPCKNGGTCQDFGTYASCACPQYLTGPTCEAVDCSGSNPCYNGGTCSGAKCLCMPGYSGILCWTQT